MNKKRLVILIVGIIAIAVVTAAVILFTQKPDVKVDPGVIRQNKFLVSVYGKDFSDLVNKPMTSGPWTNVSFSGLTINTTDDLEFVALMVIMQKDDNSEEPVVYDSVNHLFNIFDNTYVVTAFRNDIPIRLIFSQRN